MADFIHQALLPIGKLFLDDLLQPLRGRQDRALVDVTPDPAPAELLGDSGSGSRPDKGIEHNVPRPRGRKDYAFQERPWLLRRIIEALRGYWVDDGNGLDITDGSLPFAHLIYALILGVPEPHPLAFHLLRYGLFLAFLDIEEDRVVRPATPLGVNEESVVPAVEVAPPVPSLLS